MSYDIAAEITELKKKKNVAILAHYYESGDIQDIADYVGDSYYLAKMGQEVSQPHILMCGVVFMAEGIKILNPEKTILVPDLGAGCSLVSGAPYDQYLQWRLKFPTGIAVTYINSSAQVKAISDVIVTSSNAKKIIEAIPRNRPILFGPDKHLGAYLAKESGRHFELWQGSCQVHVLFSAKKLYQQTLEHPDAVVIAHPECDENVLQYASVIGSTSRLLEEVHKNPARKFIVATETGIFHQMKKVRPDAEILQAPTADETCGCNDCPFMKLNTLLKIKAALLNFQPEIKLEENLRAKAQVALERMMTISSSQPGKTPSGKPVIWPEIFTCPTFPI